MHRILYTWLVLVILFNAGCTGETGPAGADGDAGSPGRPSAIHFLIMANEPESDLKDMIITAYSLALFPLGTTIEYALLQNGVPAVAEMDQFDAILCYTNGTLPVAVQTTAGDRLADYVDNGGSVVLGQGAFSETNLGPLAGRIMTSGYSPFTSAGGSGDISNRKIDFFSLTFPLHPIFNGTDVVNLCFQSQPNYSAPIFDATATLIALDTDCAPPATSSFNGIGISANGRVMAINIYPNWHNTQSFPAAATLVANCILYAAGAF